VADAWIKVKLNNLQDSLPIKAPVCWYVYKVAQPNMSLKPCFGIEVIDHGLNRQL
jgi:hypothetical protein